jgi:ubiquitin-conjugating enzyme E2 H
MSLFPKRVSKDIRDLMAAHPRIETVVDEAEKNVTLHITIEGPVGSLYEGGRFTLCCVLMEGYPIKSPSVVFETKIWHPNVEPRSGAICLDVLGKRWTPIISLPDLFQQYIPQLLHSPEPSDPFNSAAAEQMLTNVEEYNAYVRRHTFIHAIQGKRD